MTRKMGRVSKTRRVSAKRKALPFKSEDKRKKM